MLFCKEEFYKKREIIDEGYKIKPRIKKLQLYHCGPIYDVIEEFVS